MLRLIIFIAGLLATIIASIKLPAQTDTTAEGMKASCHGYYIHLSFSNLAGKSSNDEPNSLSIHLLSAYKSCKGLSFGAGSGIDNLEMPLLPLYAYMRYDPLKTRVSPYIWFKGGYSISLDAEDEDNNIWNVSYTENKGGLLLNAGIGFVLYTWPNIGVNMGIGYRFQKVSRTYHDFWWGGDAETVREIITEFNRFELQLGIIFR